MHNNIYNTLRTIVGVIDESGRFPGTIKFAGAGGLAPPVVLNGIEKSSISLFRTIPVDGDIICAPKYEFTVVVMETAFRSASTMDR